MSEWAWVKVGAQFGFTSCLEAEWHGVTFSLYQWIDTKDGSTREDRIVLMVHDREQNVLYREEWLGSRYNKLRTHTPKVEAWAPLWWAEQVARRLAGAGPTPAAKAAQHVNCRCVVCIPVPPLTRP